MTYIITRRDTLRLAAGGAALAALAERVSVPHEPGGHFGGDPALQKMLFGLTADDPLGQRAGARAGALSVLCGVAAVESADSGRPVKVALSELPS